MEETMSGKKKIGYDFLVFNSICTVVKFYIQIVLKMK